MFKWAVERDILDASPGAGMQPPGAETSRDRVLSDDEIRWFWKGCEEIGAPFGPLFKLLLVTAQRRGEGRAMTTGQLDLGERLWTIPGKIAKNGQPHVVRSEEHTSELQSLMRISYAVLCCNKKSNTD